MRQHKGSIALGDEFSMTSDENAIRKAVKDHYVQLARTGSKGSSCCGPKQVPQDDTLTEAREVYAGCGSPVEAAGIKKGEVVVDLGSGGGYDVLRTSKLVGESGLVIGVDATPEMIWRARETAKKLQFSNVDFRLGEIEHIPVDSGSADVVMSNCVINLAPDKSAVFRDAFRILKPGGRLVVSDMVAQSQSNLNRGDLNSWAECLAGAIPKAEYVDLIKEAGFAEVQVAQSVEDIDAKEDQSCCRTDVESVTVTAAKPNRSSGKQ